MNKFSKYNYLVDNGNNVLLYNTANDQIIALQLQIATIIREHMSNIDAIKRIHPILYANMLEKGFIVDSEVDETCELINKWNANENLSTIFSMIIIPTLECNMRCWYCYEKHDSSRTMGPNILQRIIKLIDYKTASEELKKLNIDFFGGEPLMCFKKIVWPLLEYCKEKCAQKHIALTVHFTTNAYLLSSSVMEDLASLNCPISFQITLDGNRETHDTIRYTKTNKPSFDIIVNHIKQLLHKGMAVNCRLNYTKDSLESMLDLIDDFKDLSDNDRRFLNFTFQQVWQDKSKYKVDETEERVIQQFETHQFITSGSSRYISRHCYGDFANNVVINYNGDIYKCTGRDFIPQIKEGELTEKGRISYNEIYKKRMAIKRGNKYCQQCFIYPICHCGCSQYVMDKEAELNKNQCLYGYTEEFKYMMIMGRLKALVSSTTPKNV
ncbi:MAG: radical SAM protein [Bacteroidaceae bacterium]|jgi:uncharacterized protein|nr:radical SAM protein [Bacteroidaceae bacterium]